MSLLEDFLKSVPVWAKTLLLIGVMFVSGIAWGLIAHAKILSDLDEKIDSKLKASPTVAATIHLQEKLDNLEKISIERTERIEGKIDALDDDVKEILKSQRGIAYQTQIIGAHLQRANAVARALKSDVKDAKENTEAIKETVMKKKK